MSFSGEIKNELYPIIEKGRGGQIAELASIVCLSAKLRKIEGKTLLFFTSESENLRRKYFTLLKKTINIDAYDDSLGADDTGRLLEALKLSPEDAAQGRLRIDGQILLHPTHKCAFLRGAYLCCGMTSDPAKSYHFEIAVSDDAFARRLTEQIAFLGIDAGCIRRKEKAVVYVKDGAAIVELLGQLGAHKSLIAFENVRILNDMRGNINRRVNCETANIKKTVNSSVRQIDCIKLIDSTVGLSTLPDSLRQMAMIRLQYPDEPLAALGGYFDPPIGKSGVNHRLRRIVDIADKIKRKA